MTQPSPVVIIGHVVWNKMHHLRDNLKIRNKGKRNNISLENVEVPELKNHCSTEMNVKPGQIRIVSKYVLRMCRESVDTDYLCCVGTGKQWSRRTFIWQQGRCLQLPYLGELRTSFGNSIFIMFI